MDLKDLIKKLDEDKDFENKFMELDNSEAVMEFVTKEGYSISEQDIELLRHEIEYIKTGRAELSDDELDNVAGGMVAPVMVPMGTVKGPTPDWLTRLITIFIGESGKHGNFKTSNINAQKLPTIGVQDMKTTSLPNTTGMPSITTLPHGGIINPLDKPQDTL